MGAGSWKRAGFRIELVSVRIERTAILFEVSMLKSGGGCKGFEGKRALVWGEKRVVFHSASIRHCNSGSHRV